MDQNIINYVDAQIKALKEEILEEIRAQKAQTLCDTEALIEEATEPLYRALNSDQ